jgi:rhodanese-related sulfurtransferase
MATDMLTKLGLNAINVVGGFMAWEAEGLPVE